MEFYDSLRQRLDPFRFYPSLISNLSTLNFLILIVEHQYDLQYLFHMEIFPYFDKLAPEIRMVKLYTSVWANFSFQSEKWRTSRSK